MPQLEVERLTKDSGDAQMKAALSACIANEVRRGRPQEQAVAMCAEMVRGKVGEARLPKPGGEQK